MSTWPTDEAREAVRQALTVTIEDVHVVIVDRDGTTSGATSVGIDAEGFADAVLAALAPHVAALVRAERAAAWDEGFDAGHQAARAVNPEWPGQPTNPYRPDRPEDDRA